jgi:anaerobic selenocysteine-containing dehydrogenase
MKNAISLFIILTFFLASAAWADPLAELKSIEAELTSLAKQNSEESLARESKLKVEENRVFSEILQAKDALESFINNAEQFEPGLKFRFVSRLKFEITQEGRTDLKKYLDDYTETWGDEGTWTRNKKKVAYIYGHEVNLRDGEWRHSVDGKRFWVSNEYPEIVLSPAEYRRYAQSAAVVYE